MYVCVDDADDDDGFDGDDDEDEEDDYEGKTNEIDDALKKKL